MQAGSRRAGRVKIMIHAKSSSSYRSGRRSQETTAISYTCDACTSSEIADLSFSAPKNGQQVLLNRIRFTKRMTKAQAVALIGKHGASALLSLVRAGRVRVVRPGLYESK